MDNEDSAVSKKSSSWGFGGGGRRGAAADDDSDDDDRSGDREFGALEDSLGKRALPSIGGRAAAHSNFTDVIPQHALDDVEAGLHIGAHSKRKLKEMRDAEERARRNDPAERVRALITAVAQEEKDEKEMLHQRKEAIKGGGGVLEEETLKRRRKKLMGDGKDRTIVRLTIVGGDGGEKRFEKEAEARALWLELDADGDGNVTFNEFAAGMRAKKGRLCPPEMALKIMYAAGKNSQPPPPETPQERQARLDTDSAIGRAKRIVDQVLIAEPLSVVALRRRHRRELRAFVRHREELLKKKLEQHAADCRRRKLRRIKVVEERRRARDRLVQKRLKHVLDLVDPETGLIVDNAFKVPETLNHDSDDEVEKKVDGGGDGGGGAAAEGEEKDQDGKPKKAKKKPRPRDEFDLDEEPRLIQKRHMQVYLEEKAEALHHLSSRATQLMTALRNHHAEETAKMVEFREVEEHSSP